MKGKNVYEVLETLYKSGWMSVPYTSEEGYIEIMKYQKGITTILEISDKNGIITGIRKYSYE